MLRTVLRRTHAGWQEIMGLALLYGVYEVLRGVGGIELDSATEHARQLVRLEQGLGIYTERAVQEFSERIRLLPDVLAILYPVLHAAGTVGVLVWIYRTRRRAFPLARTALVLMTALALVVYVLYPVAPPRLAGAGFVDTVSEHGPLDLTSRLVGRFYNPVAALPSLHFAYALLVGGAIAWLAHPLAVRLVGALYPLVSLFVIVATGNHYYVDAVAGTAVALAATLAARLLTGEVSPPEHRHAERRPNERDRELGEQVLVLDERRRARTRSAAGSRHSAFVTVSARPGQRSARSPPSGAAARRAPSAKPRTPRAR